MNLERPPWSRVSALLDELLELAREARGERVAAIALGDPALGQELESLLAADDQAGAGFLSDSAEARIGRLLEPDAREPAKGPERLGPWRLGEELGRGGMGVVYRAWRDDGAFEREVAIKLLRVGLDDAGSRDRFERERRILARLQHPGIARLEDAGVTEDGRPFFVMERVDGEPITVACEKSGLDVETRIRRMIDVGEAVQFAHRNLVIHRDLKPNNILMTRDGRVKLLDFGIGKLIEPDGSEPNPTGFPIGRTPAYAAPEQIRGEAVTTATDVFNLGLLLAEVLCGAHPFRDVGAPAARVEWRVLEGEPEAPSSIARRTGRELLARRLHGDLDDIVLLALRREPSDRYPSADAFVADLRRHLDDRPVHASRGKTVYRLRKYVRRHRLVVLAASALAGSILVGLGGTAWQARRAASERDRAREAERRALAINDFLVDDLLAAAAPENAMGRPLSVLEVLDAASRNVDRAFREEPEVGASVHATLGRTYLALGSFGPARRHLETALRVVSERLGPEDPRTLRTRAQLAEVVSEQGGNDEAEKTLLRTLSSQSRRLGANHSDAIETEILLARVRARRGEFKLAERSLRRVLEVLDLGAAGERRTAMRVRALLADVLSRQLEYAEATRLCRETLELQRRELGPDHPDLATTMMTLAQALLRLERLDEAAKVAAHSYELRRRVLGAEHPSTLAARFELGRIAFERDDWTAAERAFRDVLEVETRILGPDHPARLATLMNVGIAVRFQGRTGEAERIYREVLASDRRVRGETHPETLRAMRNLVTLYGVTGERAKAARVIEELISASEEMAAPADADPTALNAYAWFLLTCEPERYRDPARALRIAARAVEATGRRQPAFLDTLARATAETGDIAAAIAIEREAVALPEAVGSTDLEAYLVALLVRNGDGRRAEEFLEWNLARRRARRPSDDPLIGVTLRGLGRLELDDGSFGSAEARLRQAIGQLRRRLPESNYRVALARGDLGQALLGLGRTDEAERELRSALAALEAHPETTPEELEEARARVAALRRRLTAGSR